MKILNASDFDKENVFGRGTENTAYARYFTGASFLNPLTDPKETVFLANVTFEPGCRNNWHIHHASQGGGQLLICTAGGGLVSGGRQARRQPDARHGRYHSRQCKALAWREEGKLVFAHRRRGSGNGLPERMVRAGGRRGIRPSGLKGAAACKIGNSKGTRCLQTTAHPCFFLC